MLSKREKSLPPKHLAFVKRVAKDGLSLTQAYMRTYGCTYASAKSAAYTLARRPEVKAVLDSYSMANVAKQEIEDNAEILDKAEALKILTTIARSSESESMQISAIKTTAELSPGWTAPLQVATLDLNALVASLPDDAPETWTDLE